MGAHTDWSPLEAEVGNTRRYPISRYTTWSLHRSAGFVSSLVSESQHHVRIRLHQSCCRPLHSTGATRRRRDSDASLVFDGALWRDNSRARCSSVTEIFDVLTCAFVSPFNDTHTLASPAWTHCLLQIQHTTKENRLQGSSVLGSVIFWSCKFSGKSYRLAAVSPAAASPLDSAAVVRLMV